MLPTKAQETALNKTLALRGEVYNSLVTERTAKYETAKESLSCFKQQASIGEWKRSHPELSTVHSQVLQNVAVRVDLALQSFFRRVKTGERENASHLSRPGYPRLKGRGVYDSITFPQADKTEAKLQGDVLSVSKIGQVRCVVHRPLIGKVKTCTG